MPNDNYGLEVDGQEFDYTDKAMARISPNTYGQFNYPALNEGDYLTLLYFKKYGIEDVVSGLKHFYTDKSMKKVVDIMSTGLGTTVVDLQTFNAYCFIFHFQTPCKTC